MVKDDCIFCKLANHVFDTNIIYEDTDFTVILDAAPANPGHALILPKNHYENFYEIPEDVAVNAFKLAKKLMVKITDALGCDGFNILQNNKEAADQTVPHYHMHLIPRYKDGQKLFAYTPLELSKEEQEEVLKKIVG